MVCLRWPVLVLGVTVLCVTEVRAQEVLQPLGSCAAVDAAVRARAVARMEATLDHNLEVALSGQACRYAGVNDGAGGPTAAPGPVDRGGGGAQERSRTNVQVPGVDEPDLVKNDDRFIYLASGHQLLILAAWPAESTHVLSATPFPDALEKMFVAADRVVLFSSTGGDQPVPLDVVPGSPERSGTIRVLDVTDKAVPRLVQTLRFRGSLLGARRVEGTVHAVLALDEPALPDVPEWPPEVPPCTAARDPQRTQDAFAKLKASNRRVLLQAPMSNGLASAVTLEGRGPPPLAECPNVFVPPGANTPGFLTVLSFPLAADKPVAATTLLGAGAVLYATAETLYVASQQEPRPWSWWGRMPQPDQGTLIHAFQVTPDGSATRYQASGRVPGRLVNQFAMDDAGGFLRVATTVGVLPDPGAYNVLSVLTEENKPGELDVVGTLTGLAPGEDIRAVRFDGTRAFVVTFKKTDPLWVLDVTDPRQPRVQGALHIPGFSTYIHPLDPTHLLTLGYDAADQGEFAWFTGIQLQLFDISVLEAPRLLYKESIGTRGTTSDATADHLAFTWFPERQLLALPLGICLGGDAQGTYGSTLSFNGLRVYRVTPENGFQWLGDVDHRDPANPEPGACATWWQNPDSAVKRSLFMEDYVTSISARWLKVNNINRMAQTLVSLPLPR